MSYYYDDVRTVYDIFQRGLQVSSKSKIKGNILNMTRTTYLNSFKMQLDIGDLSSNMMNVLDVNFLEDKLN